MMEHFNIYPQGSDSIKETTWRTAEKCSDRTPENHCNWISFNLFFIIFFFCYHSFLQYACENDCTAVS